MRYRNWLGAAALALVGAAFIPLISGLSIGPPDGAPLVKIPLSQKETFSIRFTHSIDALPIVDTYAVNQFGLFQTETRLISFGAGMGHIAGQGIAQMDGQWTRIVGMQRPIGTLRLRVGSPEVGHALEWRGRVWELSRTLAGSLLLIEPARLSLVEYVQAGWQPYFLSAPSATHDAHKPPAARRAWNGLLLRETC